MKAEQLPKSAIEYVFFLCPDFPLIPLSGAIEVLSTANKVLGYNYYSWKFASVDGNEVPAANGIPTPIDMSLEQLRRSINTLSRPNSIILCAGSDVENHEAPALLAGLREFSRANIVVGGISTAAYLLAAAKLLEDRECVVHWEILPKFQFRFTNVNVSSELFRIDSRFCTCAGGLSAIDMMMAIISKEHDAADIEAIAKLLILGDIRLPKQRQRLLKIDGYDPNGRLAFIIKIMEKNIAEPLSMKEIASMFGISRRQVERWFEKDIGCSPASYYIKLRLETADYLLQKTSLSISEIAAKTGFEVVSHFSSSYKKQFGVSPTQKRKMLFSSRLPNVN